MFNAVHGFAGGLVGNDDLITTDADLQEWKTREMETASAERKEQSFYLGQLLEAFNNGKPLDDTEVEADVVNFMINRH